MKTYKYIVIDSGISLEREVSSEGVVIGKNGELIFFDSTWIYQDHERKEHFLIVAYVVSRSWREFWEVEDNEDSLVEENLHFAKDIVPSTVND